jgi:hypothetical protein
MVLGCTLTVVEFIAMKFLRDLQEIGTLLVRGLATELVSWLLWARPQQCGRADRLHAAGGFSLTQLDHGNVS